MYRINFLRCCLKPTSRFVACFATFVSLCQHIVYIGVTKSEINLKYYFCSLRYAISYILSVKLGSIFVIKTHTHIVHWCVCMCVSPLYVCMCFQRSQIKQLEGEVFRGHFPFAGHRKTNIMVTNRCVIAAQLFFSSPFLRCLIVLCFVSVSGMLFFFSLQSCLYDAICTKMPCHFTELRACVPSPRLHFIFIPFVFYRSALLCCSFLSAVFVQEDIVCERDRFCRPF